MRYNLKNEPCPRKIGEVATLPMEKNYKKIV